MKTFSIIPIIAGLILLLTTMFASAADKYTETMLKNIEAVYTAASVDELQKTVNTFMRIGEAEKDKWEPFYYAAFGNIMMFTREKDAAAKDSYLDLAMAAIDRSKKLAPEESEIVALEGFVHMMRVTVDPAARGQQYAGLAMHSFQRALTMSSENPRAAILLAQMQFGTAQFFGSPTTDACNLAKKAIEKFESFQSENPLAPQWGRGMADDMVKKCKN
jgi:hypothetical protein